MIRYIMFLCLVQAALLRPEKVRSQPDFTNARRANDITFYQDLKQNEVYYYLPGSLTIGATSEGHPDLSFTLMRYAGSTAYHDEGQTPHFRNILTMGLMMKPIAADSLRKARQELQQAPPSRPIQLKPLPISQIEAMVVFTPVGQPDTTQVTAKGEMAAESTAGYTTSDSYWQERYFTLFLDNNSAQLLLQAFNKDLTAISFMYAFYAKGLTTKRVLDISGYGQLESTLKKQLTAAAADSAATDSIREVLVKSDAFPINIDTIKNPDLIHKIDINDAMPPGYAVLNVRDYDFANHLRTDLYEKTVELQATGAGGNPVNLSVSFRDGNGDITSVNFRFKYAVRLDKPYQYRIHELLKDGSEIVSDWTAISVWSNLLDVTTRPPIDKQ